MDGTTSGTPGGAAAPVVHEGSWWLLGLGLLGFALLVVLAAGALTRFYLADEVGEHRAARAAAPVEPSAAPVVRPRQGAAHRLVRVPRWRRLAAGAA